MAQPVIQASFNSGEWAPALNARVDMTKYKSGAALLRNFFIDYRGGASTRMGTKYILQALQSDTQVRLIPFQASLDVGYILEFGDQYIRFYRNGAPVLEGAVAITNAFKEDPCRITAPGHGLTSGDWVFISGVGGMSEINRKYFRAIVINVNQFTLRTVLNAVDVDATGYTAYTAGGTVRRVYTITTPYSPGALPLLKYSQDVNRMILTHPSFSPEVLTIVTATNWTLAPITIGTTMTAPTGLVVTTTLAAGTFHYSYTVTAVDANGQESAAASPIDLANRQDLRTTAKSNKIRWAAVSGAKSYNVYKAELSAIGAVPNGVPFGFIGNVTGVALVDSNIQADFSQTPPIAQNPFQPGAAVASTNVTNGGSYTAKPNVTFAAPGGGAVTATGGAVMQVRTVAINNNGVGYADNDLIYLTNDVVLRVTSITGPSDIGSVVIEDRGSTTAALPANPVAQSSSSGAGTGGTFDLTWEVESIQLTNAGNGYSVAPAVNFSAGAAAATASLGPQGAGNPSVSSFFQQRLALGAPLTATQTLFFSQPGSYFNYDVSNPPRDDNAITASLVSGQLNNIRAMVSQPAGLLVLSDSASWLINGGSPGSGISPLGTVANAQSFAGISDVPPIVANADILYVQSKGSVVRAATYNFYSNVFTGPDISILSSHLFYGYQVVEWAWAEEPFKVVWAVRNDGDLLSLTYLREQEFCGWAHSDTQGTFKSVATIVEETEDGGYVNAVYFVVNRTIAGIEVKYIERMAERIFPNGMIDAWCVDSGLQYDGAPATSFSGGEHLRGRSIVGLADGIPIVPFIMPISGNFTLPNPASKVTVGLNFTPQLQTLAIDTGDPTIQGKQKKIPSVTVRVQETLGLSIGSTFNNLVRMKDLALGNVGSASNTRVTDLVTGDAKTILDPKYTVAGQYCIQQPESLPATILGVIPELTVGDTK